MTTIEAMSDSYRIVVAIATVLSGLGGVAFILFLIKDNTSMTWWQSSLLVLCIIGMIYWLWVAWSTYKTRPWRARLIEREKDLERRENALQNQRMALDMDRSFYLENQQLPHCERFPDCIRDKINVHCDTYPGCIEDWLREKHGMVIDSDL